MTATTVAQVDARNEALLAEFLAGATACGCCGDPSWDSVLGTPGRTAWVDVDLRAIHDPADWYRAAAFLGHAPMRPLPDGRFRVDCRHLEEAITIARHLRVLGTPADAITIGGGQ